MNNLDRTRLKLAINDRIDELTLSLRPAGESQVDDDAAAKLDQLVNGSVDSALSSTAMRNLRLLKDNLDWLDSEEGGCCADCGCEIDNARLLALPTTRLCVSCAGNRERK